MYDYTFTIPHGVSVGSGGQRGGAQKGRTPCAPSSAAHMLLPLLLPLSQRESAAPTTPNKAPTSPLPPHLHTDLLLERRHRRPHPHRRPPLRRHAAVRRDPARHRGAVHQALLPRQAVARRRRRVAGCAFSLCFVCERGGGGMACVYVGALGAQAGGLCALLRGRQSPPSTAARNPFLSA